MIPRSELAQIGSFAKPHGIKGEISVHIDGDTAELLPDLGSIFVDVDGLMVPFTIVSVRPKGAETVLLTLKGIDTQEKSARFTGKEVWVERSELPEDEDDDADGFYLEDLVGFDIVSGEETIGRIDGFDDSTDNLLFTVDRDGAEILIPASADFIDEVDTDNNKIYMTLPEGLLNL